MGNFVSLHPNAYRDLIRSILIPYILAIFIYYLYTFVIKKNGVVSVSAKLTAWWEHSNTIDDICVTFTLITLINSIMMLVGIDTPKQGVFAYIHMMTRLVIISFIITLITWKDAWNRLKKMTIKNNFKYFYQEAHSHIIISATKFFAAFTVLYCIIMIVFQTVLNPAGGALFYQVLLGMFLVITFYFLILRGVRSKK